MPPPPPPKPSSLRHERPDPPPRKSAPPLPAPGNRPIRASNGSAPWIALGVGLFAGALLLACVAAGLAVTLSGRGAAESDPPQQVVDATRSDGAGPRPDKPGPPAGPSWAPPDKAVRQGDVEVRVVETSIGKVPLKRLGDDRTSKDDLLSVKLELHNVSPTRKVEYRTWSAGDFSLGRDFATLKDDLGNGYKRITFGFASDVVGAVKRSESIYPGKSVTDVLVFEVPVGAAAHLDLELPASNYEGRGTIRFRIPVKSIARESD
jgi:hypothetical protein